MSRRVYVDLDGVLADFDGLYARHFGHRPDRSAVDPPGFWENLASRPDWFEIMDPLPDALELWHGLAAYDRAVLTGIPRTDTVPDAAGQKCRWVWRHVDPRALVITCKSADKRLHCRPGDILIDDWDRYRSLWEEAGGVFILHTSARQSLLEVAACAVP